MLKLKGTFHQTLAVLAVVFSELCLGISAGWLAPTLILLQKYNTNVILTLEECSWIASLEHVGKIVGALTSALLVDVIGRKFLLTFTAFVFFIQWPIVIFAKSALVFCAIRITFGFSCGLFEGVNTVYLGETCTPSMRSILGTIAITANVFALTVELIIATYFSFMTTALINSAITFLTFLSAFWLKEPAQFLLMKGNRDKALENLMWTRGVTDPNEVKTEFEEISEDVAKERSKKSSFKETLTAPANYKSLCLLVIIYSLVASAGYFPVMSYSSMFFSETNVFTSQQLTILLGMSQFLFVCVSSFVIDRFNRRSIIMTSFSIISLAHAGSALLYYVNDKIYPVPYFSWLIFICMSIFVAAFVFTYPAIFLIRSELFPLSIKAVGGCSAIISFGVFCLLTTKMFISILTAFGIYVNFVIFSIISVVLVIFVYFCLPETRNKSLIEIQKVWSK
ncbi:facilitated trehalose transporter Tret1-like isoform X2 [Planococcus citri]|uniref:facilitated trehalose transporter Tret1-like isoform X2 n=1 Tax=Planococcus citri TaxID=170843 RepID=UPI0031F96BB7